VGKGNLLPARILLCAASTSQGVKETRKNISLGLVNQPYSFHCQKPCFMSNDSTGKENYAGDTLLLIVVIWMLLNRLLWSALHLLVPDYYSTKWFEVLSGFTNIIWALVPLALAFVAKGKTIKTVLLILGGLYLIYGLVQAVLPLMKNLFSF
jgi:hypothetical protein